MGGLAVHWRFSLEETVSEQQPGAQSLAGEMLPGNAWQRPTK